MLFKRHHLPLPLPVLFLSPPLRPPILLTLLLNCYPNHTFLLNDQHRDSRPKFPHHVMLQSILTFIYNYV